MPNEKGKLIDPFINTEIETVECSTLSKYTFRNYNLAIFNASLLLPITATLFVPLTMKNTSFNSSAQTTNLFLQDEFSQMQVAICSIIEQLSVTDLSETQIDIIYNLNAIWYFA